MISDRDVEAINKITVALTLYIGAKLVIDNDTHGPGDLVSAELSHKIALGAGLTETQIAQARQNSADLVARAKGKG